eukprot:TRINITY_DN15769_c0_g2_i1.p1 TRINITY_DN15769_c0_g2~~TRINITY_DN15769_c0_g2_i1.p1  ORF type:complete len:530 (+),score=138.36 TRINITY_DN15769_c0_g2_i1:36-1592(+)
MTAGTSVSIDSIISGAASYFAKHQGLVQLLSDALTNIAKEQPLDPVTSLQQRLQQQVLSPPPPAAAAAAGAVEEAAVQAVVASDDGGDFARPPDEGLDGLQLLIQEALPGSTPSETVTPPGGLCAKRSFAGGFSRPLLEGWLPQPSPCCGAASLAGAFNALWDLGRSDASSASIREVADLMARHCEQLCAQRRQRLARLLGVSEADFEELLAVLDERLSARGLSWTKGSGPEAVTKTAALETLRALCGCPLRKAASGACEQEREGESGDAVATEEVASSPPAVASAVGELQGGAATAAVAVREALALELAAAAAVAAGESNGGEDAADAGGAVLMTSGPDWKQEFNEFFIKRKAVRRLLAERPNTSEVGSWGIKQAAEDITAARGSDGIRVHTLLARKGTPRVLVPLEKNDDEPAVEKQWSALREAFSRPNTVLLFHLTNHYALVYAWREWQEEADHVGGSRRRRQLLTARKGQRPSAWLDFEEARTIMLGWSGYHVLQLTRDVSGAPGSLNPARAGA